MRTRQESAQRPSPFPGERLSTPVGGAGEALAGPRRGDDEGFRPASLFEYPPGHGCSPQIWGEFSLHSLGIQKLSILLPQAEQPIPHQASSGAWGFVVNNDPQPVDKFFIHRGPSALSTVGPQDRGRFPQAGRASPHRCPLFGNVTPAFTTASERRHTDRVGWAVGNVGKAGDGPGEKPPVLCTGCAQLSGVHRNTGLSTGATHRVGGQKTGSDLGKRRYPPFPQALLLLPPIVSPESASKWGLCTTRRRSSPNRLSRLDPEQHRVSVPYVRLVPGVLPRHRWSDPTRRRRPAGRASNSRRRFR